MAPALPMRIRDQQCWLSAERCLFWEDRRTLVLADLHFGKTGHFRQEGIPVPQRVFQEDLQRLVDVNLHFKPERIILAGDLFHSRDNLEHRLVARWLTALEPARLVLVRGNHDRLQSSHYGDMGIERCLPALAEGPFLFIHDADDAYEGGEDLFRISGHVHPGIRVAGLGRQSLRLPCFHATDERLLLPAFSKFTGMHLVRPGKQDAVVAVLPGGHPSGAPTLMRIQ